MNWSPQLLVLDAIPDEPCDEEMAFILWHWVRSTEAIALDKANDVAQYLQRRFGYDSESEVLRRLRHDAARFVIDNVLTLGAEWLCGGIKLVVESCCKVKLCPMTKEEREELSYLDYHQRNYTSGRVFQEPMPVVRVTMNCKPEPWWMGRGFPPRLIAD